MLLLEHDVPSPPMLASVFLESDGYASAADHNVERSQTTTSAEIWKQLSPRSMCLRVASTRTTTRSHPQHRKA